MIGFYDYTVILTYISFASSISGIFLATRGHFNWAIFCLAFSGPVSYTHLTLPTKLEV